MIDYNAGNNPTDDDDNNDVDVWKSGNVNPRYTELGFNLNVMQKPMASHWIVPFGPLFIRIRQFVS